MKKFGYVIAALGAIAIAAPSIASAQDVVIRDGDHHGARAFSMAVNGSSPYVRVNAQACRGLAHTVSGRFDAAVGDLEEALSFARRRRAGLEIEARILADLANAYRLKGDLDGARRTAAEAIEVASARAARIPECLARIVRAELLLLSGDDADQVELALELQKVRGLIEETGAMLYQPLLQDLVARIELGRGHSRASGAPRARRRNGEHPP